MVAFGGGKKGQIKGCGKIGRSDEHSIDKVYYVEGLRHNLLSISQLCDKDNKVIFRSTGVEVINLNTQKLVLTGKKDKHVYTVDTSTMSDKNLVCLSLLLKDPLLWNKRLGHARQVQLNKLITKDLVIGLPKNKFKKDKVCEA